MKNAILKMKKYLMNIIILTGLGLGFTSCGNDDDSDSGTETNSLVGLWQIETMKFDGVLQTLDSCIALQTIEFDGNNNSYATYYDFDGTDCILESKDTLTYSYINNLLTVYEDGDSSVSEVLLLNATKLEIKTTINFNGSQIFEASYKRQ